MYNFPLPRFRMAGKPSWSHCLRFSLPGTHQETPFFYCSLEFFPVFFFAGWARPVAVCGNLSWMSTLRDKPGASKADFLRKGEGAFAFVVETSSFSAQLSCLTAAVVSWRKI